MKLIRKFYKYSWLKESMTEYEEWLKKAEEDFDTALYLIDGGKMKAGSFYLQQAAEKALKAVYIKKRKELMKTHDLVFLARSVGAPSSIQEGCKILTLIYQYSRYPDVNEGEEFLEIEKKISQLVDKTKEVITWTKQIISKK